MSKAREPHPADVDEHVHARGCQEPDAGGRTVQRRAQSNKPDRLAADTRLQVPGFVAGRRVEREAQRARELGRCVGGTLDGQLEADELRDAAEGVDECGARPARLLPWA